MATRADVRRIALSLPETEETPNHFAFSVRNKGKLKGFVWVWMERIHPKKARVPQPKVIAARVASLDDKEILLARPGEVLHRAALQRISCSARSVGVDYRSGAQTDHYRSVALPGPQGPGTETAASSAQEAVVKLRSGAPVLTG